MRRKQIQDSKINPVHDSPNEVMAEGIVKRKYKRFSQEEIHIIICRRNILIQEGISDWRIAKKVATEIGRTVESVYDKILDHIRKKVIEGNRNKHEQKDFTQEEIDFIISRRKKLALEGHNDKQISKKVAKEMGRTASSVEHKIWGLFRKGKLKENKNKRIMENFSQKDIHYLIHRRNELAMEGMNDWRIVRIVAQEIEKTIGSVEHRIKDFVLNGMLKRNANKRDRQVFSQKEIDFIILRRNELESKGMKDKEISVKIALEIGKKAKSISDKIRQLVKNNILILNRNKKEKNRFSEGEVDDLILIRKELAQEGMNDWQISRKVAEEKGRLAQTVSAKIRDLIRKGKLEKNENKQEMRLSGFFARMADSELVEYARNVLIDLEIKDRNELHKADCGLYQTLLNRNLLDHVFPEPAKKSESELLAQLKDAVEMYLGKGEDE